MENSNTVSIIGLSEVEEALNFGEDYTIEVKGTCNKVSKTDNEDGSVNYKHSIKQKTASITSSDGKQIVVKDKKSQSLKLRGQLVNIALEAQIEPEEFYETTMIDLRHYLPELIIYIAELKKQGL